MPFTPLPNSNMYSSAFSALANVLETISINYTGGSPYEIITVFTNPPEQVSEANFPCFILSLASTNHIFRDEAAGYARTDFTICMHLLLGNRQTPIDQLHQRTLFWPSAVADKLFQNLKLAGTVEFIGKPRDTLFTYQPMPIVWAGDVYFGIKFMLPVTIKIPQIMSI